MSDGGIQRARFDDTVSEYLGAEGPGGVLTPRFIARSGSAFCSRHGLVFGGLAGLILWAAGCESAQQNVRKSELEYPTKTGARSEHGSPQADNGDAVVQREIAQAMLDKADKSILLCLRNPYDVEVLDGADAVLCTCGDGATSLQAAVDALLGRFSPTGRLPVPVRSAV